MYACTNHVPNERVITFLKYTTKLALRQSALQKLNEFKRLGYPPGLLRGVCNFMGATTGEGTWIGVRNAIT